MRHQANERGRPVHSVGLNEDKSGDDMVNETDVAMGESLLKLLTTYEKAYLSIPRSFWVDLKENDSDGEDRH